MIRSDDLAGCVTLYQCPCCGGILLRLPDREVETMYFPVGTFGSIEDVVRARLGAISAEIEARLNRAAIAHRCPRSRQRRRWRRTIAPFLK